MDKKSLSEREAQHIPGGFALPHRSPSPSPLAEVAPEPDNRRPNGRIPFQLILVSLFCLGVCSCLLAVSWGRWGEFLIDYGREVSIPWRIYRGELLYRDISFAYGPLSPYVQALLFSVFGLHLRVVLIADACILAVILAATARLVFLASDASVAVCSVMVLFVISGLNHMMGIAIFNLLTPYSHALTYGLALSLCALVVLSRQAVKPTSGKALVIGLLTGLVVLTKPEVLIGLAAGLLAGGFLLWRDPDYPGQRLAHHLCVFSLGGVAPSAVTYCVLAVVASPGQAGLFMWRAWGPIFESRVTNLAFIQHFVFGTRELAANLGALGRSLVENVLIGAYIVSLGVLAKHFGRRFFVLGPVVAVALTGYLYFCLPRGEIQRLVVDIPRAWPTLMAGLLAWLLWRRWRGPRATPVTPGLVALCSLTALALALCVKIFINATLLHYGAMLLGPAGAVWTIILLWFLPGLRREAPNYRPTAFAGALTLLILFLWPILVQSRSYFATRTERVSTPQGSLVLDGRGVAVRALIAWLDREATPGDTLAILPEGAMLNFLSGHPNPTAYDNILLWDCLLQGEKRIEDDFRAAAPDWIVLMHRPTPEYEIGMFCQGYGQGLCRWIADNYEQAALWGDVPNRDNRFGIMVLRHRKQTLGEKE